MLLNFKAPKFFRLCIIILKVVYHFLKNHGIFSWCSPRCVQHIVLQGIPHQYSAGDTVCVEDEYGGYFTVCKARLNVCLMAFNTTFNNISVLLVEETGENHRPIANH